MQLAETAGGLSFQADTYSGALHATPLTRESAKHIRAGWLEAFSHLGRPQEIKTDNGPVYIAQATQAFLENWEFGIKQVSPIILQVKQLLKELTKPLKHY